MFKFLDNANNSQKRTGLPAGAAQDDFILSSGDKLNIVFRGQRKSNAIYDINNQGLLVVEDLPPVSAAGRTNVRDTRGPVDVTRTTGDDANK